MRNIPLAILLAVAPVAACAATLNGPVIGFVATDKVRYQPGGTAVVSITLNPGTLNPGTLNPGAAFNGSLDLLVWLRGSQVGSTQTRSRLTVAAGTTRTLTFDVPLPAADCRGYLITVRAKNSSGAQVDQGVTAAEACSDPYRFPRLAAVTKYDAGVDTAAAVNSLKAYQTNLIVTYGASVTHDWPAPDPGTDHWKTLIDTTAERSSLSGYVSAAHAVNALIWAFQDMYMANDNYVSRGVLPRWGLFKRQCSPALPCTQSDQAYFGGGWRRYGWITDRFWLMNPVDPDWRQWWVNGMRALYGQFSYDGVWIDTVGDLGPGFWDAHGNHIDVGGQLPAFTNAAIDGTGKPAAINQVGGWNVTGVAERSIEPFMLSEIWSSVSGGANDTPTYADIDAAVTAYRKATAKAVVLPAYIEVRKRNTTCGSNPARCFVDVPDMHYLDAMVAIAGAWHQRMIDTDNYADTDFYWGPHMTVPARGLDYELRETAFEVGYENILREGVTDSLQPCSIVAGATSSATGAGGAVFAEPKFKAGFSAICHLLNLSQLRRSAWADDNGTNPAPVTLTNITVKMYYINTPSRLWWASPDVADGEPQAVRFRMGSDERGTFITATVPSLAYWDMLVLESTGLTGSDFGLIDNKPIHSAAYTDSSPGISAPVEYLSHACCHRWTRYPEIVFPSAATSMTFGYAAPQAATVQVRIDSEDGPLAGSSRLSSTGSLTAFATTVIPVSIPAGTHDIYLIFPDGSLAGGNMQFR